MTQLHDMDGDGMTDLAAFGGGTVTIWLGDGAGNWSEATHFDVGEPGYSQAFRVGGDADHNGRADIVLVDEEGSWPSYQNHLRFYRETSHPAELSARLLEPSAGDTYVMGSIRFIDWAAGRPWPGPASARLELSTSGPDGPWAPIANDLPENGRHQWDVHAQEASSDCHVRLTVSTALDTVVAVSDVFMVAPPEVVGVVATGDATPSLKLMIYPNPSRLTARLAVTLPDRESVFLEIFDVSGRRVMSRSTSILSSGDHTLHWDGRDPDGRAVPSGVYLARLRAGAHDRTRIFSLIR